MRAVPRGLPTRALPSKTHFRWSAMASQKATTLGSIAVDADRAQPRETTSGRNFGTCGCTGLRLMYLSPARLPHNPLLSACGVNRTHLNFLECTEADQSQLRQGSSHGPSGSSAANHKPLCNLDAVRALCWRSTLSINVSSNESNKMRLSAVVCHGTSSRVPIMTSFWTGSSQRGLPNTRCPLDNRGPPAVGIMRAADGVASPAVLPGVDPQTTAMVPCGPIGLNARPIVTKR